VIAESRNISVFDLARCIDASRRCRKSSRRPTTPMREASYASEGRSGGGVFDAGAK
jgi:hypothetical protein